MFQEKVATALAASHRKRKASNQRIDLRTKRQKSFLQFLRARQNEEITDSDLITAFSLQIPPDAAVNEIAIAAEATRQQIIEGAKLGWVTLTAVVMGPPRLTV